jgi:hypothetical protein
VRWGLIGRRQLRLSEFLNSDRPRTLLAPRRLGTTATAPRHHGDGATAPRRGCSEPPRPPSRPSSKPMSQSAIEGAGGVLPSRLQMGRQVVRPPPSDFKVVGKCCDRLQTTSKSSASAATASKRLQSRRQVLRPPPNPNFRRRDPLAAAIRGRNCSETALLAHGRAFQAPGRHSKHLGALSTSFRGGSSPEDRAQPKSARSAQ